MRGGRVLVSVNPLYWKLSGFYFFYFASIGAFIPFWGLYLQGQGLTPAQIGELMAIVLATKIIAPNVWGWIADYSGQRMRVIRIAALLALLCFSGVLLSSGYAWLAVVMALFSFFWNAALPQFEVTTLNSLGAHTHRYARIRLWGSVGFVVAVMAVGAALEYYDIAYLPWLVVLLLGALWLTTLSVREPVAVATAGGAPSLRSTLRDPRVLTLLSACFLLQASHGPYYAFFTLYLEQHGYARSLIGQLWGLGVLAEVAVFLIAHRLLARFGAGFLLAVAMLLTTLRWGLLALWPEIFPVLLWVQMLHAVSYGLFHAAAISLIHELFPGRLQGRGQALYTSLGFGLGGALGSLMAGYLWASYGAHSIYFMAAGLAAGALLMIGLYQQCAKRVD